MSAISVQNQVVGLPASHESYMRQGWKVIMIPPGTKGPTHKGWNKIEGCIDKDSPLPDGWGIGLAHAYSGTMALDVDDWDKTVEYLKNVGIDLPELFNRPDSVAIDSGNPGHGKLIFAMPLGMTMPSKKITVAGVTAFELRCATKDGLTVQDVLPPSKHPSGTSYRWTGAGNWQRLPTLPPEIMALWQKLDEKDVQRSIPNCGAVKASWDEVVSATMSIDPNCDRRTWIHVGMAIHSAGVANGDLNSAFALWNDWSKGSAEKYKPGEMVSQFKSFKPDPAGVNVGTLFHHAKEAGWKRPIPDVSELFKASDVKAAPEQVFKILRSEVPAPAANLELWPKVLADRAIEVSQEVGCDPVVPLIAGLAAVCAAVDKRTRLHVTDSWSVPPILWLMTVGDPSDKKTPGSKPMFSILKTIELEDGPRYAAEYLAWQGKEAKYVGQMKAYREFCGSGEAEMPNTPPPRVDPLPPEPQKLRLTVMDSTSQKIVHLSIGRPRGFLLLMDEMSHWLNKINDSKSGENRGCWIHGYESMPYDMDRVGAGSIGTENLAIPIYGNCQPTVFKKHMQVGSEDGLIQRFIPVVLNSDKTTMWQDSTPGFMSHAPAYEAMIRQSYALPVTDYYCSKEAYEEFRRFSEWHLKGRSIDLLLKASPVYMTAMGKIEGTCLRLALLFHIQQFPHEKEVSGDTMLQAVNVMEQFFVPSLRYSFMEIVGIKDELGIWVTEHIIQLAGVEETVTLSEIKRSARRQVGDRTPWEIDQDIRMTMDELTKAGYTALFTEHNRSATWTINPALAEIYKDYRQKIIAAKQATIDHFKNISIKKVGKPSKYHHDAIGYEAPSTE